MFDSFEGMSSYHLCICFQKNISLFRASIHSMPAVQQMMSALVHFRTLVTLRRVRVRVWVGLELVRVRLGLDLGLGLC